MLQCSREGCDWAFTTAYKLKRHEESHEGKKDFYVRGKLQLILVVSFACVSVFVCDCALLCALL